MKKRLLLLFVSGFFLSACSKEKAGTETAAPGTIYLRIKQVNKSENAVFSSTIRVKRASSN